MLKFVGVIDRFKEVLEGDYYIPLKVRFNNGANSFINLWRVVYDDSLFEIAIDNRNGLIAYLTLVNIDKTKVVFLTKTFTTDLEIVKGSPVCDLTIWQEKDVVDYQKDCFVEVGERYVRFLLMAGGAKKYYQIKRTYIGVDDKNEFCEIVVNNLSQKEFEVLKSCLLGGIVSVFVDNFEMKV